MYPCNEPSFMTARRKLHKEKQKGTKQYWVNLPHSFTLIRCFGGGKLKDEALFVSAVSMTHPYEWNRDGRMRGTGDPWKILE